MLKDHLHYTKEIVHAAAEAVSSMGAFSYVAVHLRRNDFQYAQAGRADGEQEQHRQAVNVLEGIKKELRPGEPLYIATDELDEEYLKSYREALPGHQIYHSTDFRKAYKKDDAEHWRKKGGLIEQVVCAGSRFFFSMPASTYSAQIKIMRDHMAHVAKAPEHGAKELHNLNLAEADGRLFL